MAPAVPVTALRDNMASSLLLGCQFQSDWTPCSDAYFAFPMALCSYRVSSASSRLPGVTTIRFALSMDGSAGSGAIALRPLYYDIHRPLNQAIEIRILAVGRPIGHPLLPQT